MSNELDKKLNHLVDQIKELCDEHPDKINSIKAKIQTDLSHLEVSYQDEQRYNLALQAANEGVWDWDVVNNYIYFSPKWLAIVGYTPDEIEPTIDFWRTLVHPDDLEIARRPVSQFVNSRDIMPEAVYRMKTKAGGYIYTAHRGKALYDESGNPVRIVGTTRDVHRETIALRELEEQNKFVNSILNTSKQIIFVKSKEGKFLLVNERMAELFNKPIDQIINKSSRQLHYNEEENNYYDYIENDVLTNDKSMIVEETFTDKSGKERIFQTIKSPLVRTSGEKHLLGIATDITELKNTQNYLLRKEREYRGILESLRVVVGRLDDNGRFNYFNPAFVKYLTITKIEDVFRVKLFDMIHEDDLELTKTSFDKIRNGSSKLIEAKIRMYSKIGLRWFDMIILRQENAEYENEIIVTLYDVTTLMEFSQQLEQRENIFRTIAESSADIICLHETNGDFRYISPAATAILGYDDEELIGHSPLDYIHADDKAKMMDLENKIQHTQEGRILAEIRFKHKNNDYVWLETTASIIRNSDGETTMLETSSRDVSIRRKIEEERVKNIRKEAELNEFQRNFVMMSSHQLRTPLTIIRSDIELLELLYSKTPSLKTDRIIGIVNRIKLGVDRMTKLMEDILTLGKLGSKEIQQRKQIIQINELVEELVADQFIPLISGRILKVQYLKKDFQIDIDKNLFVQALSNLIANADKYSIDSKQSPEVILNVSKNRLIIHVIDYGIGIPLADKNNLFQPFFRGSNTQDYKGTGLGLRIAKEFFEMNGGKMEVKSEVNKGTTVLVELPL